MNTATPNEAAAATQAIAMRKRDLARRAQRKQDEDPNYYVVFVFNSQSDRDGALSELGLLSALDDVFLPGRLLAEIGERRIVP